MGRLDPPQRRQRTLDAVKRLLLRESQAQPLVLVFEDLHWIDCETQALLDSLVDSLGSMRVLLLVNYRPEYEHRWGNKTSYTQLRLENLPPESPSELLATSWVTTSGLEPLKQLLRAAWAIPSSWRRASVRSWRRGSWKASAERTGWRGRCKAVQIPATVQAILAARSTGCRWRKSSSCRPPRSSARMCPLPFCWRSAELTEETLRRALSHLQDAEFLYEMSLFPDLEYTFKHALTHEVVYGGLLHDRRRQVHAAIVEDLRAPPCRTAWVSRRRGSLIMPCEGRCGRRR